MFSFQSGSSFFMLAKNLHDLQSTQNYQILLIIFAIWKPYTRMLRGCGEFFSEFFDLEMCIYQNFLYNSFWGQFLDSVLACIVILLK